jgi:RNA polymerase sigma-70 factor (ECF subfamily)
MPPRFTNSASLPILRDAAAMDAVGPGNRLEQEVVALFDRFREPLLRYLSSFGLSFADGEEVIQEVFLALFQHLNRGKSRDNLRGWLFRVAHNLALKRRCRTLWDSGSRAERGAEDLAQEPGPNPEEQVVHSQTQQRLQAVVQALRNWIAGVSFCGPKACVIGRLPRFSICPLALYHFL